MAEIITSGQVVPKITEGLHLMDGIEGLRSLPRHSVDMLLTDPPYGTTKNYWDTPLPLPELWEAIRWAVKPNGAVLLFAQCPFDKALGASNLGMLRYEWVWVKAKATGFLNANRAPLKKTENILVFYQKPPVYNPQFTYAEPYKRVYPKSGSSPNYGKFERTATASNDGRRYPTNVLYAPAVTGGIQADVMGNLHRLGVQSIPLDGRDRLALLHSQMHPGGHEAFRFSWKDIPKTGLGTKDYIAPDSFDFRQSRTFRVGQHWGAASYLQILASELSDKLLAEMLELDAELTVTMHIQTVDQLKAIKTIKGKISDIGRMKAEEQKKAVRAGYDMEILPPDLITFSKDAAELLADLQSRNERMFLLTFTVVNLAPTRQRLENDVFTVSGIAQKYNCAIKRLDWQQEQAFVSSLVLGYNGIEIQRGMTTSSTAIFIPFMTRELRMDGQALYYGMNALSHNVIMADRKKLKSANGLYLGSTGSGKSFAAKRELINVFLATNDRIVVVDPMGEYAPLARRLGAQVIEMAVSFLRLRAVIVKEAIYGNYEKRENRGRDRKGQGQNRGTADKAQRAGTAQGGG